MQPVWTQVWQASIALLGVVMLLLTLQRDKGKLPVHHYPALNGQQPSKLH